MKNWLFYINILKLVNLMHYLLALKIHAYIHGRSSIAKGQYVDIEQRE